MSKKHRNQNSLDWPQPNLLPSHLKLLSNHGEWNAPSKDQIYIHPSFKIFFSFLQTYIFKLNVRRCNIQAFYIISKIKKKLVENTKTYLRTCTSFTMQMLAHISTHCTWITEIWYHGRKCASVDDKSSDAAIQLPSQSFKSIWFSCCVFFCVMNSIADPEESYQWSYDFTVSSLAKDDSSLFETASKIFHQVHSLIHSIQIQKSWTSTKNDSTESL